jgi:hypothetical protein
MPNLKVLVTANWDFLDTRLRDDFEFEVWTLPSMLKGSFQTAIQVVQAAGRVEPQDFDYAILVNERGVGLLVAEQLPQELRSRTLVVLELSEPAGREDTYRALGYSSFCKYGDVPNTLKRMYQSDRDPLGERMRQNHELGLRER